MVGCKKDDYISDGQKPSRSYAGLNVSYYLPVVLLARRILLIDNPYSDKLSTDI